MNNKPTLNRGLKNRHVQLLSLGGIIGSGYFLGTGYILEQVGPAGILAYLLGGVIVLCVMLSLAELAVHRPVSSSFITYANDYISPMWACGVGWAYWLNWIVYVPAEMIAAGIIMNNFVPEVSQLVWAIFFALVVTFINLFNVGKFGEAEFWLSLIKISALIIFSIIAFLICFGIVGDNHKYIGTEILLGSGGFAPHGYLPVFLTMVIILVNFQGSEIIGLAAGECEKPEKSIPIAVRNVTWRIIALYIIPITLLISILPWDRATLSQSVFAEAMHEYGLHYFGYAFSFVILTAAISCSNSGLYGAGRALYGLSIHGMAPKFIGKLNKKQVPQNSIMISVCSLWLIILLYTFDKTETAYTYLLAVSGFTGAMAWICICWSQYRFRKMMIKKNLEHTLKYKTPLFPYVTLFGIWIQILCLLVLALSEELRSALYLGIPMLVVPMIIYKIKNTKKKNSSDNN